MELVIYLKYCNLPVFLHATHAATFAVAESSITEVEESASQTGLSEVISHPSASPSVLSPQTLQ